MLSLLMGVGSAIMSNSFDLRTAEARSRRNVGECSTASWLEVPNTKSWFATWRIAVLGDSKTGFGGATFFFDAFAVFRLGFAFA
ncbi:hypothetical protein ABZ960_25260, partial [Streptomyces pseudovenezuelae]